MKIKIRIAITILTTLFICSSMADDNSAYQEGLAFGKNLNNSTSSVFDGVNLSEDIPHYAGDSPKEVGIREDNFDDASKSYISANEDASFAYQTSKDNYHAPYSLEGESFLDTLDPIRNNPDKFAGDAAYCTDGECYEYEIDPNTDMTQATAVLNTVFEAGTTNDPEVDIFRGTADKCEKNKLGNVNCCRTTGWGLDWGLSHCKSSEEKLAKKREQGLCVYVGEYKKTKSKFGMKKTTKYESFCCFKSKFATATHKDGRKQVGKSWGSPKYPDCSAFKIEEYERLDYSKINLEDVYDDTLNRAKDPDHDSMATKPGNYKPISPGDIKSW